ncbi:hypothetical protein [Pseudomonas sp. PI1]|uniref:hypothetical protein n=1 Tax=Pseudomonas sp. PI1 TaxID=1582493 RepID=UPI0009E44550|nr:hypothetical protein [Pseudomonas sp. PI1]
MSNTELWESGELGRSEEHAAVATGSKQEVDDALGLQLISIRLQKQLVGDLKKIAEYHGVGYQPMIRDLLNRFARSEIKKIMCQRLNEIEASEETVSESSTAPVKEFMEKMRA